MKKKILLYLGFILLGINLGNSNLFNMYSYLIQRIAITTINPEIINKCDTLQAKIENYIFDFRDKISISVLTDKGEFIVDVNSKLPRIPASNQKILSSAFSLDILGPNFTLDTSLKLLSDGGLYIESSGDPDFNITHLNELVSVLNRKKVILAKKIPIIIKNEEKINWWPSSWSNDDRKEEYGAPITSYSISSNASLKALKNPIDNFVDELETVLTNNNLYNRYYIKIVNDNYPIEFKSTLYTIYSAPLYVLLNLVNSESHNFTSEVIFRHSLDNWSHNFPNTKYSKWLKKQNFVSDKFIFADASGLSRKNRVTTYGLTQFLRRMKSNRFNEYYFSSFSILGVRGSLARVKTPVNLKGKILAKSGTLNNVKSISGVILDEGKYFSIIVNNMDNSLEYIVDILSIIEKDKICI